MLSLNDITNVSFRKAGFSGYRPEDVDDFIDRVKESFEELMKKSLAQQKELEQAQEEKRQLQKKLEILAEKIEDYRSEEDEIKNALVSAQKLGDASVREARHKAEIIVKDANLKAEHIVASAEDRISDQKRQLEELKKQVSDFRSKLLDMYRQHLTLIDALPTAKKEAAPAEAQPPVLQERPEPEPAPAPSFALEQAPFAEKTAPDPDYVQEPTLEFQAGVSNFDDF